jgi:DNA-binding transcriptional regulator PaaX
VSGEHEVPYLRPNRESTREVQSIQRTQHGWEGLGRTREDVSIDPDQVECLERFEQSRAAARDLLVRQAEPDPGSVQRA